MLFRSTDKNLGTVYDYRQLGVTLGIELEDRVRMATGVVNPLRRRKQIIPNMHLWVANRAATYGYDPEVNGAYPPQSYCASPTGILRDDRDELAKKHWLSVAWYGPTSELSVDKIARRNASWALHCCGDIPSSAAYDGGACVYPTVGQCVLTLTANGQVYPVQTPVSSVVYDNESGTTTWTTDWQDLDFQ